MSLSRQVRPVVHVNGTKVPVLELEVTNASHFTADTYRVVMPTSALPPNLSPAYWSDSVYDQVTVGVSIDDAPPNQLIVGQVDDIDYDPIGKTLTLTGRDLSAPLIDAKTAEKFQNLRSHEIAQRLALRHGLDSQVTATTALAGSYYEIDHVTLTQEQTEWDLLIFLAQKEGFDVWVSGTTLYFQPQLFTGTPYVLFCSGDSNMKSLKLQRSENLAKDVIVKVQSWNQKQQRSFTVQYHVTQAKKGQRTGGIAQTYSYTVPNLSRDQALQLAQSKAEQITRHERVITAALPGDNLLTTRTMLQLVGTATDWDQTYYVDSIHRRLSMNEGYVMDLRAKNHSPQSTVVL